MLGGGGCCWGWGRVELGSLGATKPPTHIGWTNQALLSHIKVLVNVSFPWDSSLRGADARTFGHEGLEGSGTCTARAAPSWLCGVPCAGRRAPSYEELGQLSFAQCMSPFA